MLPGPPKSSQTEDNMVILALSWPILGATCCQLGPSCVHLGPIFAPTSPKISTKSSRSAPRHPKTTQGVARGLQDSPWSLNFHGFGVDFGLCKRKTNSLRIQIFERPWTQMGLAVCLLLEGTQCLARLSAHEHRLQEGPKAIRCLN